MFQIYCIGITKAGTSFIFLFFEKISKNKACQKDFLKIVKTQGFAFYRIASEVKTETCTSPPPQFYLQLV